MTRRIVFYTDAFGGGGAEIVFARLALAFAMAGDDVIFAADRAGPGRLEEHPRLDHIILGPNHLKATLRLCLLLRQFKPDVSFSALGSHNLKHLAAALLAGRHRRSILGFHGFAEAERKLFSLTGYWMSFLVTRVAGRTVCVSDTLRDDMVRRWRASAAKTVRIYNPLAFDLATTQTPKRAEPPLIVACGRFVPAKRFEDLVAALPKVRPSDTRLAILGDGPEREALLAEARRLGIEDRISCPGFVDDPTPWYAQAACVAISSKTESFGLVVAEALAVGTPVVSTRCGGPSEILDNGRFGYLVPIGDIDAIAAALTAAIAEPGAAGPRRERAKEFAIEPIYLAYRNLADDVAKAGGRRMAGLGEEHV